jgi:hypothetical protein
MENVLSTSLYECCLGETILCIFEFMAVKNVWSALSSPQLQPQLELEAMEAINSVEFSLSPTINLTLLDDQ